MLKSVPLTIIALVGCGSLGSYVLAATTNQTPAFDSVKVNQLLPRQVPSIPAQCQSICEPINVLINGRCTPRLCCNANFSQSFFNCYKCASEAFGLTDYTQAQKVLDDLGTTCAASGAILPRLTFPGQNPSRTISSFALGPTNTASNGTLSIPTGTLNPPKTTVGPPGSVTASSLITSPTQSGPSASSTSTPTGPGSTSATIPGTGTGTSSGLGSTPSTPSSSTRNAKSSLLAFAGAMVILFMI